MEKTIEKQELELGKYSESDLIELTDENINGGTTPASPYIATVIAFVSENTCPTTACTRAC